MTNGDKEKSSPLHADNLSSHFSSGSVFLLLPGPYGVLYGVLFDDRHMKKPLGYYVNVTFFI